MVNEVPTADGLSAAEFAAWGGFLRAHATLVRALDEELARTQGLPLTAYDVLVQLDRADERRLRMSELADAVLLSRSGLTRLVARLADQGLIERVECENDARGAYAVLTDQGRRRLEAARGEHLRGVRERFLDRLSDDDQRRLAAIWQRLIG